jgi:hypothetical protein
LGSVALPATAATRPPDAAGPTSRHFICANGLDGVGEALGFADGFTDDAGDAAGAELGGVNGATTGVGVGDGNGAAVLTRKAATNAMTDCMWTLLTADCYATAHATTFVGEHMRSIIENFGVFQAWSGACAALRYL